MKKMLLLSSAIAICGAFSPMTAADLTINNTTYSVDTMVVKHSVGPGTTYAYYRLPNRPLEIHVLEIDRTNPYINLEVWNGGSQACSTERPTSVGQRYTAAGIDVVAVHNGDFFTTTSGEVGMSRMGLIGNGECIFNAVGWPLLFIEKSGTPYIEATVFNGSATLADGTQSRIHTVNMLRLENETNTHADQLSLYTPAFGKKMHGNSSGGTVAVLKPAAGSNTYPVNKNLEFEVVSVGATVANNPIPEDGSVLHGVGTSAEFLNNLKAGDTITLYLGMTMPAYPDVTDIREAIGGNTIILKDGQVMPQGDTAVHPRTFMGISQDKSTIYSVVVDGRYDNSAGIAYTDEGEVLRWLGAWDGVNLDGGGSSCMVVNNSIRNHPSDKSERAVGNGVIFYSTAPKDNTVDHIALEPGDWRLPVGATVTPRIFGFNKYDLLIDDNFSDATLSCDPEIGQISADGHTFIAATTPAKGELTATSADGMKSTVIVDIRQQTATPTSTAYIIDNRRNYDIQFTSTVGAQTYKVSPASINWTSGDQSIATVNADGQVRGVNNGNTTLTGSSNHFNGSIDVTSESVDGNERSIFHSITASELKITQSGGKNITATQVDNGFNFTYTGTGAARTANIQITGPSGKWQTYGLPDAIVIEINPGNAPVTGITLSYKTSYNVRGAMVFTDATIPANQTSTFKIDLNKYFDTTDNIYYPITFSALKLSMGTSEKDTEYTLSIPRLYMDYSGNSGVTDLTTSESETVNPDQTRLYKIDGTIAPANPAPGLYIRSNGTKELIK